MAGNSTGSDFEVLGGGTSIEHHDALVRLHGAGLDHPFEHIEADGRFGADADAFGRTGAEHPLGDLRFAAGRGRAAAGADGIEDHEVAHRHRHAQAAGHRLGVREEFGEALAPLEGADDRAQPSAWQEMRRGKAEGGRGKADEELVATA